MSELIFASFSGTLLDQGQTLFFPSLQERDANPIHPERANEEAAVQRLTLVGNSGVKLSGEIVGLTLYAQVDVRQFRSVRSLLRERNLADHPVRVAFELDENRALHALTIDGRELR